MKGVGSCGISSGRGSHVDGVVGKWVKRVRIGSCDARAILDTRANAVVVTSVTAVPLKELNLSGKYIHKYEDTYAICMLNAHI